MWINTTSGFFSLTQSTYEVGKIQIRARDDRSLERLIETFRLTGQAAEIVETPKADYRWRILVTPRQAAAIVSAEVMAIDYSNFKNAAHRPETNALHPDLMATWSAGMRHQHKRVSSLGGENLDPYRHMSGERYEETRHTATDHVTGQQFEVENEEFWQDTEPPAAFTEKEPCENCDDQGCPECDDASDAPWTCFLCGTENATTQCQGCGNSEGTSLTAAQEA